MEIKEALLQALRTLKSSIPELQAGRKPEKFTWYAGICNNTVSFLENNEELGEYEVTGAYRLMLHTMEKWPEADKQNPYYPVGGIDEYENSPNLWKNPRRIELLDWLIGELENGH